MIIDRINKRVQNKWHKLRANLCFYYTSSLNKPIMRDTILLEAGQGLNLNGNMFALLRALKHDPKWRGMKVIFVTVADNREKAMRRMNAYGFRDVVLVNRLSKAYYRYLARAAYLATDNSFPPCFQKRDEQVYLNTWHGTPLKTLGRSDKSSRRSYANIQKNYMSCSYALFPNDFTRDVFFDDYDLRRLYRHDVVMVNYPRNEVFYDAEGAAKLRQELDLADKQVLAYMPTWRGAERSADIDKQIRTIENFLKEIDRQLRDDQMLFVNLHFLVDNSIHYDTFRHIRKFPACLETYDFLKICDVLITDYSSVFFDFAVTGRKIILFAYDKEEYLKTRGMYIDLDALPFPVAENTDQLMQEINNPAIADRSAFLAAYCPAGSSGISSQVLDLLIEGKQENLKVYHNKESDLSYEILFGGRMNAKTRDAAWQYMAAHPDKPQVFVYRGNLNYDKIDYLNHLPSHVVPFGLVNSIQFTFSEFMYTGFSYVLKRLRWNDPHLKKMFSRERERLFPGMQTERVINYVCRNPVLLGILHSFPCAVESVRIPLQQDYTVRQLLPVFCNRKQSLDIVSMVSFKSIEPFRLCDVSIHVDDRIYHPAFLLGDVNKSSKKHFALWRISIPKEDITSMGKNNFLMLDFGLNNPYEDTVLRSIRYDLLFRNFSIAAKGPVFLDTKNDLTACFRQAERNKLMLLVRDRNITDAPLEQVKLFFAFLLSRFMISNRIILLFEKESSRYEESASVLYEELIDQGYQNVYFILSRDYPYWDAIDDKYKENILRKGSFKHYLYFFASKTFIGSEATAHALDISVLNRIALQKILSTRINYVFLQHGVMYMVSLDSPSRNFFRRKEMLGNYKYRVVVSSHKEAAHFVELGGHEYDDLYISGLPKFDRNKWDTAADKIVIMPTWRPWEFNEVQSDPTESGYYKMMMRIAHAIPAEYQDKILLLPHPLFQKRIRKSDDPIKEKFLTDEKYDTILQHTALLITDYSSIAYDAFYRGAQVIFYWEEKDACMQAYGKGTKLMLNEENTFAPVAYNAEALTEAVKKVYRQPHTPDQDAKYSEIVEFHDGHNAKRLIKMLKEDHIL